MPSYEAEVAASRGVLRWIATRIPGMQWLHLFGLALAIAVMGLLLVLFGTIVELVLGIAIGVSGARGTASTIVTVALLLTLACLAARRFRAMLRLGLFDAEAFVGTTGAVAGVGMAIGTWLRLLGL